jgi:ACT domain-containing protein
MKINSLNTIEYAITLGRAADGSDPMFIGYNKDKGYGSLSPETMLGEDLLRVELNYTGSPKIMNVAFYSAPPGFGLELKLIVRDKTFVLHRVDTSRTTFYLQDDVIEELYDIFEANIDAGVPIKLIMTQTDYAGSEVANMFIDGKNMVNAGTEWKEGIIYQVKNGSLIREVSYENEDSTNLFLNGDFKSGTKWHKPRDEYPTELIDNLNDTVTINAQEGYSAMVAENYSEESGVFYLECDVVETVGTTRMVPKKKVGDDWFPPTSLSVGTNVQRIDTGTDAIDYVIFGADSDATSSLTLSRISLRKYDETTTPVMTGAQTPYGTTMATSVIDGYPAWRGMNNNLGASNAWLTEVITDLSTIPEDTELGTVGHYMEWKLRPQDLDSGMPPMLPTKFTIYPRGGVGSDWYGKHNPQSIYFVGIKEDDSLVKLYEKTDISDWRNGDSRTWDIPTHNHACKGFRIYIGKTNNSEAGTDYHTGFGHLVVHGDYPTQ